MLFSQKLTVFFVLGGLVILIGTPVGLYKLSRPGTEGIVGAYLLAGVVLALVLVLLDRFSLRFVATHTVSAVELVLVLATGFWYASGTRTTTLDLSGNPSPYFAVVWTKEPDRAEELNYQFPFDQVIHVPDRAFVCLDGREFSRLSVTLPASWQGSSRTKGFDLTHPHYSSMYIHQPEAGQLSDAELDQIKQRVLAQLPTK